MLPRTKGYLGNMLHTVKILPTQYMYVGKDLIGCYICSVKGVLSLQFDDN